MNIGIVTTWFERGAAYVSKQFKEVWEEEHNVSIYVRGGEKTAKSSPEWNQGNITYGKRFSWTSLDFIDIPHLKKWIEKNDLDIVFFNEQHIWTPVLACKEMGVLVGSYIDYYTQETVPFFHIFDFLICNTQRHLSVFSEHKQAFYIPWGTNQKIYNSEQRKKVESDELVFFHSAGMNPERKGTDILLEAYEKIDPANSRLVIHTQKDLTVFFPKLSRLIDEMKNSGKLKIIKKTVSAPGLYHLGDVYVYPTRLEGIGLTIMEAASCAMPIITTNESPMNEFVKDEINGKLIRVKEHIARKDGYYWEMSISDSDDLAKQMKYYIDNSEQLDRLKDEAMEYAQNNFDWSKNAAELNAILYKVKKQSALPELISEIEKFEKKRPLRFYVATSVPYQWMKKKIKQIF